MFVNNDEKEDNKIYILKSVFYLIKIKILIKYKNLTIIFLIVTFLKSSIPWYNHVISNKLAIT